MKIHFEVMDREMWNKFVSEAFKSEENLKIVRLCQRWAGGMEYEIDLGAMIEQIAESMLYEANMEKLGDESVYIAKMALCRCWKHGKVLNEFYTRRATESLLGLMNCG